jgi:acetolactate synthase-1/2/3 large subunit
MATSAEILAGFLAEAGVRRLYGVPGDGSGLDLIAAARRQGLTFVASHRAAAAAFMAATEGDLSGLPGVCLVPPGAAGASVVGGVAQAFLDRLPLILFTPRPRRASLRLNPQPSLNHLQLFRAVTRDRAAVTAARAERLVRWAWDKALALPRGPIHLDLPADEAGRAARKRGLQPTGPVRSDPSASAIRSAARILTQGGRGRAVVVAGLGCREAPAARALRELVEHLGAPVLTTYRAKGVIPEDHPLAAGAFSGARLEEELLGMADAVLAVGVDPGEVLSRPWSISAPVVSLAECSLGPGPFEAAGQVVADLPASLVALREALPPAGEWGLANWARRGGEFRLRARSLLAGAWKGRGGSGLPPHRVVEIAREVFPRGTVAAVDGGAHAPVVATFWNSHEPKSYLCSTAPGAIGCALPAAIAAKLVAPSRPAVVFVGDGGFLISLPDVATAVQLGIAIVVIVFVDGSRTLVRVAQEQRRYALAGVPLGTADIPRLAEGLDALAIEVAEEAPLRSALEDALATAKPAIIAVRVRPQGYRRMYEILRGKPTASHPD